MAAAAGELAAGPRAADQEGELTVPFKSAAQRRKFAQLLVEGKISDQTFEEWNRETGRKVLPERVKPKAAAKRRGTVKAKPRSRAKLSAARKPARKTERRK
jgi:hypothetical protein